MQNQLETLPIPKGAGAMQSALLRLRNSDLAQKVAETFATRIALLVLGVATSIAITRSLGPEGRGVFAIASTLSAVGVQFGDLGLSSANIYFVSKDRAVLPALIGNALFVSFGMGTLAIVLLAMLDWISPGLLTARGFTLFLALIAIPPGLAVTFTQNLLMGVQDVRGSNRYSLWIALLMLALVAALGLAHRMTAQSILIVGLITTGAGLFWTLRRLQFHAGAIRFSAPLLRLNVAYGVKFYIANFFAFMLLRSDMLMVGNWLGKTQAGLYAVAITLANLFYMLPNVVGSILFPRLSATKDVEERWQIMRKALAATVGIVLVSSLAGGLLARPFIVRMYGAQFEAAVPAFLCLLPGLMFWGASGVLSAYLSSEPMPLRSVFIFFVAFALNLALNFTFLRAYGIVAASVDSSVCYALSFALLWIFVLRPMRKRHLSSSAL